MTHNIPSITLLCKEPQYIPAFNDALKTHWPSHLTTPKLSVSTLPESLHTIPPSHTFDLIVSPANSYGLLDGAFDDAISRTFCVHRSLPYEMLTHAAQDVLYERFRGFAPRGSCTLVKFPRVMLENSDVGRDRGKKRGDNVWGCSWVGICPTMRVPENVVWDKEVVYECVWSLMCEVERHNRGQENFARKNKSKNKEGGGDHGMDRIDSIVMTPLATGVGKVSKERWAAQVVLALKHFVDAVERPERWGRLTWMDSGKDAMEVDKTVKY